jgi:glyoxylase-like metal-dependent hydrolase (beta-lactamase superfamily II)
MTASFLCMTCATQFPASDEPPVKCPICRDERQYVLEEGQQWVTYDEVRESHRADIREERANLTGIGMKPEFGIGQRALLVESPNGNVLWDCLPLLDEMASFVESRGGLRAIAISHPHYYTTMVEWGRTFDVPVLVHGGDREWVVRPDAAVTFWNGETYDVLPGVRLVHCGGHFAGSAILHWEAGADGRGALLTGDTIQVVADHRCVSFMRSYPNMLPLPASEVTRIARIASAMQFDRIYGAFWDRDVTSDARRRVQESAGRYIAWLNGGGTDAPV